jgi:hypothetical protein
MSQASCVRLPALLQQGCECGSRARTWQQGSVPRRRRRGAPVKSTMRLVPVTHLAGFLGSGKATLPGRILQAAQALAPCVAQAPARRRPARAA